MKYCPVMPRCMVDAMPRDMQLYTRIERQDEHENQYQIRQVNKFTSIHLFCSKTTMN